MNKSPWTGIGPERVEHKSLNSIFRILTSELVNVLRSLSMGKQNTKYFYLWWNLHWWSRGSWDWFLHFHQKSQWFLYLQRPFSQLNGISYFLQFPLPSLASLHKTSFATRFGLRSLNPRLCDKVWEWCLQFQQPLVSVQVIAFDIVLFRATIQENTHSRHWSVCLRVEGRVIFDDFTPFKLAFHCSPLFFQFPYS